ncbi:MAG TPA: PLD nuclease N-terminal domain-containing protein [Jatrophihabitantaceae bacterium]|jgi:hypothetical protein|nr:PLD nuclease N-terminal domain-containing protein [Jatrophihabitantaceae bacterium]
MVLFDGFVGLIFVGIWIFCIIDVITTPEDRARNLPKIAWLLIVIVLVDVGSIAWLVAGHTWDGREGALQARTGAGPRQGGRSAAPRAKRVATNPDDDEDFLAGLQARADEQRRRAKDANPHPDEDTGSPT